MIWGHAYLCQNIVHSLASLLISLPEESEKAQYFHLEEGVRDARHIMFRAVSGGHQGFEIPHKKGHGLKSARK